MDIRNITNREELISYLARGKSAKYLCFWGHTNKDKSRVEKSCFSQWYPAGFEVKGIHYKTAEHFMMAEKARLFDNHSIAEQIIQSNHPKKAKDLGRHVTPFDQDVWFRNRFEIVVNGNIAKFSQNKALKEFLVNTGKRVLVEASPADKIWGIGLTEDHPDATNPFKWPGLNLLGFALMVVRQNILERMHA